MIAGGYDRAIRSTAQSWVYTPARLSSPVLKGARVDGRMLIVSGESFIDGAKILLNGEVQKTRNDDLEPMTVLIGKKAAKRIMPGDSIRVRNPDGAESSDLIYTPAP